MSYDISITAPAGQYQDYQATASYINSLPDIKDLRFRSGDDYYMEIDIEHRLEGESGSAAISGQADVINLHIPYDYMKSLSLDHDRYYDIALQIAAHLGWRAYDRQLDLYLDDKEFLLRKRRRLNGGQGFDKLSIDGRNLVLRHHNAGYILVYDLDRLTASIQKVPAQEPDYTRRETLSHSPVEQVVAVPSADEKTLELRAFDKPTNDINTEAKAREGKLLMSIPKCGRVKSIKYSRDGSHIFSNAYRHHLVKLWRVSDGKLIKNFSGYAPVRDFVVIDGLLCISSEAGLSFFDLDTGKLLITTLSLQEGWIDFTPDGDYDCKAGVKGAIQLNWIDNDKNESYVFLPDIGFAFFERWTSQLNKIEPKSGKYIPGLFAHVLKHRLQGPIEVQTV